MMLKIVHFQQMKIHFDFCMRLSFFIIFVLCTATVNASISSAKFDEIDVFMAMDTPAWKFTENLNFKFKQVKVRVVLRTRKNNKRFSTKLISETLTILFEDKLQSSVPVTVFIFNNTLVVRAFDEVSRKELDSAVTDTFVPCNKYGTGVNIDNRQILMANYADNDEIPLLSNMQSYIAVELEFE